MFRTLIFLKISRYETSASQSAMSRAWNQGKANGKWRRSVNRLEVKNMNEGLTKMELLAALDMSKTGEVPMSVVARLGLAVEKKPKDSWVGMPSQLLATCGDLKMPVAEN